MDELSDLLSGDPSVIVFGTCKLGIRVSNGSGFIPIARAFSLSRHNRFEVFQSEKLCPSLGVCGEGLGQWTS